MIGAFTNLIAYRGRVLPANNWKCCTVVFAKEKKILRTDNLYACCVGWVFWWVWTSDLTSLSCSWRHSTEDRGIPQNTGNSSECKAHSDESRVRVLSKPDNYWHTWLCPKGTTSLLSRHNLPNTNIFMVIHKMHVPFTGHLRIAFCRYVALLCALSIPKIMLDMELKLGLSHLASNCN